MKRITIILSIIAILSLGYAYYETKNVTIVYKKQQITTIQALQVLKDKISSIDKQEASLIKERKDLTNKLESLK